MDAARWRAERELEDGERLLWSGRGRRSWYQWLLVAAVVALVFPLRLAMGTSGRNPGTDAGAVVFVHRIEPLLWAGWIVLGLLLFIENRKAAFCCAVTNRRLLIFRRRARSFPLRNIGRVVKTERPDGSGDLKFPGLGPLIGFYGLENVRDAERAVELAVASLLEAPPRKKGL